MGNCLVTHVGLEPLVALEALDDQMKPQGNVMCQYPLASSKKAVISELAVSSSGP